MTAAKRSARRGASFTSEGRIRRFPVALTRWVLVLAIAYAIIFGGEGKVPVWPHQVFVIVVVLSNLVLSWLLSRRNVWRGLSGGAAAVDIAAVSLAIAISGNLSTNFYVVYFAVVIVATTMHRLRPVVPLAVIACLVYTVLAYLEVGSEVWRSSAVLVRLPFLLGVALYFSTAVQQAVEEFHAGRLAATRNRALRALSEMGRMALTGTYPGSVLFEVSRRVQEIIAVDRCSLIIFDRGGTCGYLVASGDDPSVDVLLLEMERYPELQPAFVSGRVIEIHPDEPPKLWDKIQRNLPDTSPFRSFLVVPIKRETEVLGVFFLRDARPDRVFSTADRDFCTQAAQMAAAFIREHDLLEQLRQRSGHDNLTGLLTFSAFHEKAVQLIEAKKGGRGPLSLAVINIDNIREINDRWSHDVGDTIIQQVGQCLAKSLQDGSAACRYCGDEFLALVDADKTETAKRLQSTFLDRLDSQRSDLPCRPGVSIGVAGFPADGDTPDDLLAAAQRAMCLAKNGGGHRICASKPVTSDESLKQTVIEAVLAVQTRRLLPAKWGHR
ncbi:MAG: diguanylate cyclase [Acidobacteriota bacterium]